jgi:hypothetical protein
MYITSESFPLGPNLWLISFLNHELNCSSGLQNFVFWLDVSTEDNNKFSNHCPYCIFESIVFDVQSVIWEDISNDSSSFSILFGVGATTQLPEGWNLSFTVVKNKNAVGEIFYSGTVSCSLWATKKIVMKSYSTLIQESCSTLSEFKGPYFPSNLRMVQSSSTAKRDKIAR